MESYEVEYGKAKLRKYDPPKNVACNEDVKIYISYESEFDRSYKLVKIMGTLMIFYDDDQYPIIIFKKPIGTLAFIHEKIKILIANTYMDRRR